MRFKTKAPTSRAAVTITSIANGKSSGSKSNVLEGCTLAKKRSSPYDNVNVVDSRLAGEATIPAANQAAIQDGGLHHALSSGLCKLQKVALL